jgi:hypothetical protein
MVAITLTALGGFNMLLGLLTCCARLANSNVDVTGDAARTAGRLAYVITGSLSLIIGALVLVGGLSLLQRRSRSLGLMAAILAMVPLSCCFLAGIPIGIWALVVLARDDVKAILSGEPPHGGYPPPGPTV